MRLCLGARGFARSKRHHGCLSTLVSVHDFKPFFRPFDVDYVHPRNIGCELRIANWTELARKPATRVDPIGALRTE